MKMFRRTITFPESELLEELERVQERFDSYEAKISELELEVARLRNTEMLCAYPTCQYELQASEARVDIAIEALDKIQNCNAEIIEDEEEGFVIIHYDAPEARDLAMLMASRALDEMGRT